MNESDLTDDDVMSGWIDGWGWLDFWDNVICDDILYVVSICDWFGMEFIAAIADARARGWTIGKQELTERELEKLLLQFFDQLSMAMSSK